MKRFITLLFIGVSVLTAYAQKPPRLVAMEDVDEQVSLFYTYDAAKKHIVGVRSNQSDLVLTVNTSKKAHTLVTLDSLPLYTIINDTTLQRSHVLLAYRSASLYGFLYDDENRFLSTAGNSDSVKYVNGRITAFGKALKDLTYPDTPNEAVERLVQSVPFFLSCVSEEAIDYFPQHLLPILQLGNLPQVCPIAASMALPKDPLEEPLEDDPANPFYDVIDARSQRLMDIEAVKPSMQLEQAVSENQTSEEMWLTLSQFDELMNSFRRMRDNDDKSEEEPVEIDLPQSSEETDTVTEANSAEEDVITQAEEDVITQAEEDTDEAHENVVEDVMEKVTDQMEENEAQQQEELPTLSPVTFHYSILPGTQPNQHILQVEVKGEQPKRPEARIYHRTYRFTFED